jgi:hypothetical protein
VQLRKQAQYNAGRPGMPKMSFPAAHEYGNLAAFGNVRSRDRAVLIPSALKTITARCIRSYRRWRWRHIDSGSPNMIGRLHGGRNARPSRPSRTTYAILHQSGAPVGAPVYDLRYSGNCGRNALWSQSISTLAVARNTHVIMLKTTQGRGPCTEMFYQEPLRALSRLRVRLLPHRAALGGGKYKNHLTPLEIWFASAVFKGAAGLSLEKANDIVKELIPKYEHLHANPPIGRSLPELHDIKTIRPTEYHLGLYLRIREEAKRLCVNMPPTASSAEMRGCGCCQSVPHPPTFPNRNGQR